MTSIFSRILVAVDIDEPSREGVVLGARLAHEHGGELLLCHSVNWASLVADVSSTSQIVDADVIVGGLRRQGEALLAQAAVVAKSIGIEASSHPVEGKPDEAILRFAYEARCSLIVMGTHGRRGLARAFIGSTTEAILRESTLPVLTVRPGETIAPQPRRCFERVLVGVDDSGPSDAAVATVLALPPEDRQALIFCGVADEKLVGGWRDLTQGVVDALQAHAQHVVDGALSLAREKNVPAVGCTASGIAADALTAAAHDQSADLLVVGSHGRRGLELFFLGSVAQALIRTSPVPVLVVRTQPQGA